MKKTIKLTKDILNRMILTEMHALGLASFRPSFKEEPKVYDNEESIDTSELPAPDRIHLEVITPDNKKKVLEFDSQPKQSFKTRQAIKEFQALYRQLDSDTRYHLSRWLRSKLINELTISEVVELTSAVNAASKALTQPKNPHHKK